MELKEPTSKQIRIAALVLACIVIALIIFQAGVTVGFRRGAFSDQFGGSYSRMFEGPRGTHGFFEQGLESGHGAAGTIVSLSLPTIIVSDRDNTERVVRVASSTEIRNGRNTASSAELSVGSTVVILGDPGANGTIEARLIRIIPTAQNESVNDRTNKKMNGTTSANF